MTTIGYIVAAVVAVVSCAIWFPLGIHYRKRVAEKEM